MTHSFPARLSSDLDVPRIAILFEPAWTKFLFETLAAVVRKKTAYIAIVVRNAAATRSRKPSTMGLIQSVGDHGTRNDESIRQPLGRKSTRTHTSHLCALLIPSFVLQQMTHV